VHRTFLLVGACPFSRLATVTTGGKKLPMYVVCGVNERAMRNVKSEAKGVTIGKVRKGIVSLLLVSAAVLGLLAANVVGCQNLGDTSSLNGAVVVASSSLTPAQIDCGGFGSTIDCAGVSPTTDSFPVNEDLQHSVSGKVLASTVSADGQRLCGVSLRSLNHFRHKILSLVL
jgi:hypothetical protein